MTKVNYEDLSPFEFKDMLIHKAQSHTDRMMLNAGRGNPNFLSTRPRYAFLRIGDFALQESERSYSYLSSGFGGIPEKKGIVNRFDTYASMHEFDPGVDFINAALTFSMDHLGIDKASLLHEMTSAFLGCNYPIPPRALTLCEKIIKVYLSMELCNAATQTEEFDLFPTEGATAAMSYLFNTLRINGLIKPKNKIAIITPIFSPYLEIPLIPEFGLEVIDIKADEDKCWQVPTTELNKLYDKEIKMLFMVNPSNPPSVKMSDEFLKEVKNLVSNKRPDLMIVSDDVYATFSDNYRSIFSTCPYNTLCVYSFSKYFGVTGWRLGTMLLHEKNIFDDLMGGLLEKEKIRLDKRYSSLTDNPRNLKFIDRLVADSRTVALNHTAGLSTPQQLQMLLLALANILDENQVYKSEAKRLIRRRYDILYHAIGLTPEYDENSVDYYTLIDLEKLSELIYGKKFSNWFMKNCTGFEFIIRLADETSIVLLPGKGFEVDHPSARISLANLTEHDYRSIGLSVRKILQEYNKQYTQSGGN